jgi:hypothetical protein
MMDSGLPSIIRGVSQAGWSFSPRDKWITRSTTVALIQYIEPRFVADCNAISHG